MGSFFPVRHKWGLYNLLLTGPVEKTHCDLLLSIPVLKNINYLVLQLKHKLTLLYSILHFLES